MERIAISKLRALEVGPKRVRVFLGGEVVADTKRVTLVWEIPNFPQYYFPIVDVRADLVPTGTRTHSPNRGDATHFTVTTSSGTAVDAAWQYPDSRIEELRRLVRFDWDAMDGWFEEDEEVFTHHYLHKVDVRMDLLVPREIDGELVERPHTKFS